MGNYTDVVFCLQVQYGFNALGDFLVDKGANRDARNDEGKTPYEGL